MQIPNNNKNTVNNSNSLTFNYNKYISNNLANDSNYNSERPSKKTNKNFNSNESNEFTSNFSDIVNFDDINQIIKKPQTNENYISNPYNRNINEFRKRRTSKLEIGDLEVNVEKNFHNLNNFSHKNSTKLIGNSTITSGKNLSNITSYSQNEKENTSKVCSNENTVKHSCKADKIDNCDIFEKLNLLKQRTKYVLTKYAENFGKKK